MLEDKMTGDEMLGGRISVEKILGDEVPGHKNPEDTMPGDTMPGDTMPENKMPESKMPEKMPEDNMSKNRVPEGQDHESSAALKPRRLLRGEVTYAFAKEQDANILHQLGYLEQRNQFFQHLHRKREVIKSVVSHHLGLSSTDACHVVDEDDWIHGSFNVCIRVDVHDGPKQQQFMIRFPLPYRIGENCRPGNADEKVRCEAGTYAWLQENCPTVCIPRLYGFGLSTGKSFTHHENLPIVTRTIQCLRSWLLRWLNYPVPTAYVATRNRLQTELQTPYILIEYISSSHGKMLSHTWEQGRSDPKLRSNLFHGISRIMLNLARVPLPRIGSFVIDDNGYLSLSNRALTSDIHQLDNEHIPVDIPRNITHTNADSYINDILAFHESRLRHQPNGVNNIEDGFYQTSALTLMRSLWSCFFQRALFRGPFFLNLTDFSQNNTLVDDNWNIQCIIDLEWACSQPVEMIHPPYWLSNQAIDMIESDRYEPLHTEFLNAFAEEESRINPPIPLYSILKQGWERGTFWCALALKSPTALFSIFYDYIQPRFSKAHDTPAFWSITMPYWTFDAFAFIEKKVRDKENYDAALRQAFES